MVSKSRVNSFKNILDRARSLLSSNKIKTLSLASKKIFLKEVVQALPTSSMRVFKLPCSLLRNINKVIQDY